MLTVMMASVRSVATRTEEGVMPGYVDRFERDLLYYRLDRHMVTVHGTEVERGIKNRRSIVAMVHAQEHAAGWVAHPEEDR